MDPRQPLREIIAEPSVISFVRRFARAIRGSKHEQLWTLVETGRVVKTIGKADHVPVPDTGSQIVLLEIHQHRITNVVRDARASAFIHLTDIGGSFASGARALGTYMVVVDVPEMPYVVATKFNETALGRLTRGDAGPLERLHSTIEATHAASEKFRARTLGAATIHDMQHAYAELLPDLDFAVLGLSKRGPFPTLV